MLDLRIRDFRALITPGALLLSGALLVPCVASGQTDVEMLGRIRGGAKPPPGFYETLRARPNAFQFSSRNGWVRRGREVAQRRREARSRMMTRLQPVRELLVQQRAAAVVEQAQGGVVSGTVDVPVMLVLFANTDSAALVQNVSRAGLESRLFGLDPAPPYTVPSYYRELSNDSLTVTGTVFEWTRVPQLDSFYEGLSNGLGVDGDMPQLITDVVSVWDGSVDFGQFDNDGPDGVPDSGDDDGYVDAIALIHPKVDGSCQALNPEGETAIWAHRYSMTDWGASTYVTDDVGYGGSNILINDYFIQGGQGGDDACTSNEPVAIGLVVHEIGHLFALPDLYDTGVSTRSGIGRWGLMSMGNQLVPSRPAHMTAWTKAELGWITEVLISADTSLDISPVVPSDTSFVVPIANTDEYFVLENRQRIGSDTMLYAEGLLIWHVDSVLTRQRGLPFNRVNGVLPYGMSLVQGDGQNDLENGNNRGDAGDPFPGSSDNRNFAECTQPRSWTKGGDATTVRVSNITQLVPGGAVRAEIEFFVPNPVVIADTTPPTGVMGAAYQLWLAASGGIDCARSWRLVSGVLPRGIGFTEQGLLGGRFNETGDFPLTVEVTSGPVADTTGFTLHVVAPVLAVDSVVNELLGISQPLSEDERIYLDIQGNGNQELDLGDFVEWMRTTGGVTTAEQIAEVLSAAAARARLGGGGRE